MNKEFDLILERFLEGRLDEAGLRQLAGELQHNPDIQAHYVAVVHQHVAMRGLLQKQSGSQVIQMPIQLQRHRQHRRHRPQRLDKRAAGASKRRAMMLLAAALVIGVGVFSFFNISTSRAKHTVAAAWQAGAGELEGAYQVGAPCRVGKRGFELVGFDGSTAQLAAGTIFTVPSADQLHVRLIEGAVSVIAAKQQPGKHVSIFTEHAEVRVVGTEFRVAQLLKQTSVSVQEGIVAVIQSDGQHLVHAGERWQSDTSDGGTDWKAWQMHGDLPASRAKRGSWLCGPSLSNTWRGKAFVWPESLPADAAFTLRARIRLGDKLTGRWHIELAAIEELELDGEAQSKVMLRSYVANGHKGVERCVQWAGERQKLWSSDGSLPAGEHVLEFRYRHDAVVYSINGQQQCRLTDHSGRQRITPGFRVTRKAASSKQEDAGVIEVLSIELVKDQ